MVDTIAGRSSAAASLWRDQRSLGVVLEYVSTDDGRMVRVRSLGPHTTIGGSGPDDGPQWRSRGRVPDWICVTTSTRAGARVGGDLSRAIRPSDPGR